MIVGCYTVHLYCDAEGHKGMLYNSGEYVVEDKDGQYIELQMEFAGRNERECLHQARRKGWKFTRDRQVFCPFCND